MRERTVFSANGIGIMDINKQKNKLGPLLKPYAKINYKWIRNLNGRAKIIKFLEENIGVNIENIGVCNNFLDMAPKIQKTEVDKFEFIIIKNCFLAKSTISVELKKMFANYISDEELIPIICK